MFKANAIPSFNIDRVLTRVDKTKSCWNWIGSVSHYGYGTYGNRNLMAHRVVYHLLVGDLKQENTLDHLCKNKRCVNPKHLEQVSIRENVLRSDNPNAINARKTYCMREHPLSGDNLYIHPKRGTRHCKQCGKDAQKRYVAKTQLRKRA